MKPRPHDMANYLTFDKVSPRYKAFLMELQDITIPRSPHEAMKISQWKEAMDEEMCALLQNDTWELVNLSRGTKSVG